MALSSRVRVLLGTLVWAGAAAGGVALWATPAVQEPLVRTTLTLLDGALAAPERERLFPLPDRRGLAPGAPVFEAVSAGLGAPVGHVVALEEGGVRVRFALGTLDVGGLTLTYVPPSRTLREALQVAVSPEASERLGAALRERLSATFDEALLPALEERLPAFLARLDPTREPAVGAELDQLAAAVLEQVSPLLEDLTGVVTQAVDARFDFLDRVGLLWKVLRGDGEGLRRELVPVARESATAWWAQHRDDVLRAIALGVKAREEALRAFVRGPLWAAARDEVLVPVARTQRARLEQEAEALLRLAVEEVVLAPSGGFRARFAGVLRTHLLGRDTPLLFVERGVAR